MLTIQLPEKIEAALKEQANAYGVSPEQYVFALLECDLAPLLKAQLPSPPFKTGRGMLAKYGPAPSAEEIDANRAEMFRRFVED